MQDPIVYVAETNDDTMYYHQAMNQEDVEEFKHAIAKEIYDHCSWNHWKLVERSSVPQNCEILPVV